MKACKQLKSGVIPSTSERLLLQGENWFAKWAASKTSKYKKVKWGCPRKRLRKQTLIVWSRKGHGRRFQLIIFMRSLFSRKLRGSRINLPSIRFPETVVAEAARKTARKTSGIRREWHRGFRHRSNDVHQNYPMFVIFNGLGRHHFFEKHPNVMPWILWNILTEYIECRECSWSEQIITTSQQSHCRWLLVRYPTRGLQLGH